MLCKLTNHLFKSNQEKIILDILKEYKKDINIKDVELCLKIDKTIDFLTLSTKEKKNIIELLQ